MTIDGTPNDDVLLGGDGADEVYADEGNDYVYGGAGNDTLYGGGGSDVLLGQEGNDLLYADTDLIYLLGGELPGVVDYLYGDDGNDTIYGGGGNDVLIGGRGADYLRGASGDDALFGGDDADEVLGDSGNDMLVLGAGDDSASGGYDNDYLYGGDGNDSINGNEGVDVLLGDDGNDTIYGGPGVDYLFLGAGADTLIVDRTELDSSGIQSAPNVAVVADFVPGTGSGDVLELRDTSWNSLADVLANTVDTGNGYSIITLDDDTSVWLIGVTPDQLTPGDVRFGGFSPPVYGTPGDDVFENDAANTAYSGGGGNDTLMFGFDSGTDSFSVSGEGSGTLQITVPLFYVSYVRDAFYDYRPSLPDWDSARDILLSDGSRVNTIYHSGNTWTRFQSIDTSLLTVRFSGFGQEVVGDAGDELFGGSGGAQWMHGNAGNDVLFANGGADTVEGGDGFDYVSAGQDDGANDVFDGGADIDTVSYSGSAAVTIDLGAGYATGSSDGTDQLSNFEVAVGSQYDDLILGSDAHNTLFGLFGNDVIYGRAGNDVLDGGVGLDVLIGEDGDDRLVGDAGNDYLYGGAGNDSMEGGNGVDVLVGDDGNDVFFGGTGVDYLLLGPGGVNDNDTVLVDATQSGPQVVYNFEAGGANDVVRFTNTAFHSFADVQAATTDFTAAGNFMVITVDADTNVWLIGVQPAQLKAEDFLFA